jgi:type IV pilus assembly protein PilN
VRTLHLNLASRPYRNYRPVWLVAAVLAVASAIFLVNNAQTAYHYFVNTKTTRGEIDRLQKESTEESRKAKQIQDQIRRFDRKALNSQSKFINAQIAERAFSWSELLDQLERVVPSDVRLVSLDPSISADGTTHLRMTCLAKSPSALPSLIQRLQGDPHFERPFPQSEVTREDGLQQFTIEADYRPGPRGLLR